MKISFEDRKLERLVNDDKRMFRKMGKIRAEKLRLRLNQLAFADTLEDVRYLPGNYHELTGDRKGQWACDLDQPFRLIFTPQESSALSNVYGQNSWLMIKGVHIIEIVDYHRD
jgi:proteic killer suppression protein